MAAPSGPVVSNITPLIVLAGVGLLDLLPRLYRTVTIPALVRDEYEAGPAGPEPRLDRLDWLRIVAVTPEPSLLATLDGGAAAAITLALRLQARAVLLDERRGRRVAQERGLPVVGSLGVLLAAKQGGMLPALRPVLDAMIAQGRRLSPALRAQVLGAASEDELAR